MSSLLTILMMKASSQSLQVSPDLQREGHVAEAAPEVEVEVEADEVVEAEQPILLEALLPEICFSLLFVVVVVAAVVASRSRTTLASSRSITGRRT